MGGTDAVWSSRRKTMRQSSLGSLVAHLTKDKKRTNKITGRHKKQPLQTLCAKATLLDPASTFSFSFHAMWKHQIPWQSRTVYRRGCFTYTVNAQLMERAKLQNEQPNSGYTTTTTQHFRYNTRNRTRNIKYDVCVITSHYKLISRNTITCGQANVMNPA